RVGGIADRLEAPTGGRHGRQIDPELPGDARRCFSTRPSGGVALRGSGEVDEGEGNALGTCCIGDLGRERGHDVFANSSVSGELAFGLERSLFGPAEDTLELVTHSLSQLPGIDARS